jgi:hypothetical protein
VTTGVGETFRRHGISFFRVNFIVSKLQYTNFVLDGVRRAQKNVIDRSKFVSAKKSF